MNNEKLSISLKICRSCLKSSDLVEVDDEILKKFNFLLNNEKSLDHLPRTFCEKCVIKLKLASAFKEQSTNSQNYLVQFLSKINFEFTKSLSSLSTRQGSQSSSQDDQDLEYLLQTETSENEGTAETQQPQQSQPKPVQNFTFKEEVSKPAIKQLSRSSSLTKIEKSPVKCIEKSKPQIVTIEKVMEPTTTHVTAHLNLSTSDLYVEDTDEQHIEEGIFDDKEIYDIMEIEGSYVDEAGNPILENSNGDSGAEDEGSEFILVNYKSSEDLSTDKDQQFIVEEMYNSAGDDKPLRKKHMKRMPKEVIERYAQSTDNNQHICTKCVKVFSTRTNLIRHIQSHDGNKPYVCEICQKGFTQSGSLKQHMYIHSGQRPYKCNFCDRAFTQGKTLKFHLRKHLDEKPFICSECNGAFRQRDGLKRHLKTRHNIELKYERPNQLDEKIIAFVNMDDKSQSTEEKSGEILEIIEQK